EDSAVESGGLSDTGRGTRQGADRSRRRTARGPPTPARRTSARPLERAGFSRKSRVRQPRPHAAPGHDYRRRTRLAAEGLANAAGRLAGASHAVGGVAATDSRHLAGTGGRGASGT